MKRRTSGNIAERQGRAMRHRRPRGGFARRIKAEQSSVIECPVRWTQKGLGTGNRTRTNLSRNPSGRRSCRRARSSLGSGLGSAGGRSRIIRGDIPAIESNDSLSGGTGPRLHRRRRGQDTVFYEVARPARPRRTSPPRQLGAVLHRDGLAILRHQLRHHTQLLWAPRNSRISGLGLPKRERRAAFWVSEVLP
jgi:hypothetical protein